MKFDSAVSSQFGDTICSLAPDCDPPDPEHLKINFNCDIPSHYILPFQESLIQFAYSIFSSAVLEENVEVLS